MRSILSTLLISILIVSLSPTVSAKTNKAELLIQQAELAAGALKWEISFEYRKTNYKDPITYPNMVLYNETKDALNMALQEIAKLPTKEQDAYRSRLDSNVSLYLLRAQAFIDAITSGKKILDKTDLYNELFQKNPVSPETEYAYHELSSDIRKQAILLYRVYGKSTRDAILDKYKSPGENAKNNTKYVISAKMEIDKLEIQLAENKSSEVLDEQTIKIQKLMKQVDNEYHLFALAGKLSNVYATSTDTNTGSSGSNSGYPSFIELVKLEESVVMIKSFDEKNRLIGQGSGFVIDSSLLMTNFHVLEGGVRFEAVSYTGEKIVLSGIVEFDEDLDLALLKPMNELTIPALPVGSKDMLVKGEWVVAIGSPEGLMNTVSNGIISGFREFIISYSEKIDLIQFTAPITFGSSGGPLINMDGYVVGLNTLGYDFGSLNFATPIDYAREWIATYKDKPHAQIEVVETQDEKEETVVTPPPIQENEVVNPDRFYLSDLIRDAIYHPTKPIIYAVNENRDVLEINYETKHINRLTFELLPERLYFANGELYVTLLKGNHSSVWWNEDQEGAIAIIDTATFTLKTQFDILLDPYDIVADLGHIYVAGGSGQHTTINSYSRETLKEVSFAGIYYGSYIEMHPSHRRIYSVTQNSYPTSMNVYNLDEGRFKSYFSVSSTNSTPMGLYQASSPDGKYMFTGNGYVFYTTDAFSTDLNKATSLGYDFSQITFNLENNLFYTSHKNYLRVFDYDKFTNVKYYVLNNDIQHMHYKKNQLITISKDTYYNLPKYVVKIYTVNGTEIQ